MSTQKNLFSHRALASSRKVNAARRARAQDSYLMTVAGFEKNFGGATPAQPVHQPDCFPKRSSFYLRGTESPFTQNEIHFNDEMRFYDLNAGNLKCPECGYQFARLEVKPLRGVPMYRVICSRTLTCNHATEFMGTSQDAIRIWKLAAKLAE